MKKKSNPFNQSISITMSSPDQALKKPVSFKIKKFIAFLLVFLFIAVIGAACFAGISAYLSVGELKDTISDLRLSLSQISYDSTAVISGSISTLSEFDMKELPPIGGDEIAVLGEDAARMSDPWLEVEASAVTQSIELKNGSKSGQVELLNWFDGGAEVFTRYTEAVVIDVDTGRSFNVRRFGGTYHADSYPLTSEDTAKMKEIVGGAWTWDRRAVWVKIGDRYFAASINGMPHMTDPCPSNNFSGHFCIHFFHSRVHETSAECAKHQAMVLKAFSSSELLDGYLENNEY